MDNTAFGGPFENILGEGKEQGEQPDQAENDNNANEGNVRVRAKDSVAGTSHEND